MKTLFIVNPQAGRGSALRIWQRLSHLVTGRPGFASVIPTTASGTRQAAAEAAAAGYDRVVVLGGDGTQDLVAGALAGTDTILGAIPAGTGNDFCRNLGFPTDPVQALAVALGPHIRRHDLGRSHGGGVFLNAAGIGFDGEVAATATRFPKGLGGTLPYLAGALVTIARHRPTHLEVEVDDQFSAGPCRMVAVANGRYYGGGMKIAPNARTDDGRFDVLIAGDLNRMELLNMLAKVYSGTHIPHAKVQVLRGRQVKVRAGAGVRAHLDGDLLGDEPLEFGLLPAALSVAVPTG